MQGRFDQRELGWEEVGLFTWEVLVILAAVAVTVMVVGFPEKTKEVDRVSQSLSDSNT